MVGKYDNVWNASWIPVAIMFCLYCRLLFLLLSKWSFSLNFVWRRIVYICEPLIADNDTSRCPLAKKQKTHWEKFIKILTTPSLIHCYFLSIFWRNPKYQANRNLHESDFLHSISLLETKILSCGFYETKKRNGKTSFLIWLIYRIFIFFVSIWILLTYYSHILKQN